MIERKNYEGIYIFNPFTLLEEYEKAINEIKEIATEISDFNIVGIRPLAYEIRKLKEGFFITFKYNLTEEEFNKLNLQAKDNDNIIKFIIVEY